MTPPASGDTDKHASLIFLGDVMLGRMVGRELAGRPPEAVWGTVLPALRTADAVIANLECAVTTSTREWMRTPKAFHFGAPPRAVDCLKAGNVRCVSLANNHILDFETQGLFDTLDHLDRAGIMRAGAGRDLDEAMAPALFAAGGLQIGVLALTDNEPSFAAAPSTPGVWHSRIAAVPDVLGPVAGRIAALRGDGADFVVLSLHWGPNMVTEPPARFRAFAHAALDLGVDLIHGHSAHIFQAVEVKDRRLILYDTGDALDDYAVDPVLRNDWSFAFRLDVRGGQPLRLTLIPLRLHFAVTDRAEGEEARRICDRMSELSAPFGTAFERTEDGLVLDL